MQKILQPYIALDLIHFDANGVGPVPNVRAKSSNGIRRNCETPDTVTF